MPVYRKIAILVRKMMLWILALLFLDGMKLGITNNDWDRVGCTGHIPIRIIHYDNPIGMADRMRSTVLW